MSANKQLSKAIAVFDPPEVDEFFLANSEYKSCDVSEPDEESLWSCVTLETLHEDADFLLDMFIRARNNKRKQE